MRVPAELPGVFILDIWRGDDTSPDRRKSSFGADEVSNIAFAGLIKCYQSYRAETGKGDGCCADKPD